MFTKILGVGGGGGVAIVIVGCHRPVLGGVHTLGWLPKCRKIFISRERERVGSRALGYAIFPLQNIKVFQVLFLIFFCIQRLVFYIVRHTRNLTGYTVQYK